MRARIDVRRRVVVAVAGMLLAAVAGLSGFAGVATAHIPPACRTAPGGGLTLTNVASANGAVRAVGANGLVAGAAGARLGRWGLQASGVPHNLRGIAWTGDRWVAVGDAGSIVYRDHGRWNTAAGIPNSGLRGVAAKPGLVAAAGSGGVVVTSTDGGITWSVADSGVTGLLWGGARVGPQLVLSGQ